MDFRSKKDSLLSKRLKAKTLKNFGKSKAVIINSVFKIDSVLPRNNKKFDRQKNVNQ